MILSYSFALKKPIICPTPIPIPIPIPIPK